MAFPADSAPARASALPAEPTLVRGLSLSDSVLLLVGGVVGSSIFLTAKDIAGVLSHPLLFLLVWAVGGMVSLFACFAFAEMGAMFPDSGGQYVYLREAFGDLAAFLYGWMLFAVANGGSIAAIAVASATYAGVVIPAVSPGKVLVSGAGVVLTRTQALALAMIAAITWINVVGLRRGAVLQNLVTWIKFGAMVAFVVLGVTIGHGNWGHFMMRQPVGSVTMGMSGWQLLSAFGVALIAVFWAYDGWVYVTWVAGEVKEPRRNLPRAMVMGILLVTVLYAAMNITYLYALPLTEVGKHETVATAAAMALFSPGAAVWLSALVAVACFGALAGLILAGSRVYFAMSRDGVFFRRMARIHPRWRTPAFSLIAQSIWAGVLAISGRYDQLYTYVIFGLVLSYTLTVAALFVLRWKYPDFPRPYRCTGYPWLPAIYLILGTVWSLNTLFTRPKETLAGVVLILIGVPHYLYWKSRARRRLAPRAAGAPVDVDCKPGAAWRE